MKFITNKVQAILLIMAFLCTQSLMAQRGGHHHRGMGGFPEELKSTLNLTEDQSAQIEKIEADFKTQFHALRADDTKERSEKRTAMEQLTENKKTAVENILTAEQKNLLETKNAAHKAERTAKMEAHKATRKQLQSEIKAYRVENIEPVLKVQRTKLDTEITAEDKATIAALRIVFAEKKAVRKEAWEARKLEQGKRGKQEREKKKGAKMEDRKAHYADREKDEDFKTLKALVEKYGDNIAALHAEIEPQTKKWKEDQRAIIQKYKQEKKEDGKNESKGRDSQKGERHGEGKHKGGKYGHKKGGLMKKGAFLLLDPNEVVPTTAKQALTEFNIFPNPATTSNSLNYTVKAAGSVKIEIHDAQGRLVHSLFDGERTPGEYQLEVNVSDLQNRVYYYVVADQQGITTKKIIIATK